MLEIKRSDACGSEGPEFELQTQRSIGNGIVHSSCTVRLHQRKPDMQRRAYFGLSVLIPSMERTIFVEVTSIRLGILGRRIAASSSNPPGRVQILHDTSPYFTHGFSPSPRSPSSYP